MTAQDTEIESALSGGDPRSLGRTEEIVAFVIENTSKLNELLNCLFNDDEIVRMRAGDALEKVCRQKPALFQPYLDILLNKAPLIRQPSVQWHLAQILCQVSLSESQKRKAISIMRHNLETMDEWVVTNLTLEAMALFVRKADLSKEEFAPVLNKHKNSRHKSVAARVAKISNEFGL